MINVAVIGFGFMGITHALNIQRNKKMNLQAIITRKPENIADKLKEQQGNFSSGDVDVEAILKTPVYTSLRECLAKQTIDAVQICVHTDLHYELAKEAMENGLHVFLEKPMTLHLEEAQLLIHLAQQKHVKLMVGHVVRFMPAYVKLKEWIDQKTYGALQFISLSRITGLPSWGQWKDKQRHFGSSGGALFDLVIHDIDYLNYVLGKPARIKSVCYPGSLSMHDYISAYWSYGDTDAKIEGGNTFHSAFPFQAGYMARFENASILYTSLKGEHIQVCTNGGADLIPAGDPNQGFYDEIDYFADCIMTNSDPVMCSPASSLETLKLCYQHC